MTKVPDEQDEVRRSLEELYKDGRKPTLKELQDFTKKYNLKLVDIKFPSKEEKAPEEKP